MRILYGAPLQFGSTAEHRLRAFRRVFAAEIVEFAFERYTDEAIWPIRQLTDRMSMSPAIRAINLALLRQAEIYAPDWVWLDKPIYFYPQTIRLLAERGIKTISYMPDDPFGPRNDMGWRHFKAAFAHYWGHVVTREVTRREFTERGAMRVVAVPFAFEPSLHFPPSALGLTPPKTFDVSFIGSPYDDRARWILKLVAELPGIKFGLFGGGWRRHVPALRAAGLNLQPPVWNDQYREVIWRSKLSLSFITRSNRDELSHKAIEIAASGTAVLVEPSPVHDRVFRDGESAYFFDDPSRLPGVIRDALSRADEFRAVGARAARSVRSAGLSNDQILFSAVQNLGILTKPEFEVPQTSVVP